MLFNPFPGLRPFEPDEDHLFFGREKEIDELLRRLRVSRFLSVVGTLLCLLVGLPLAYFIATRATRRKALLIVLLVIPFWTSFLIRTYAWLLILGPDGLAGFIGDLTGNPTVGSRKAVNIVFGGTCQVDPTGGKPTGKAVGKSPVTYCCK